MSENSEPMSEEAQAFGRRYHNAMQRRRSKKNTKSKWQQIGLMAFGVLLLVAMVYIVVTEFILP